MNSNCDFVLKGTFAHTPTPEAFVFTENGFLVCENGKITGLYEQLPEIYAALPLHDYSGQIIIPGMCDVHQHASQYTFRGIGKNLENSNWNSWFESYAFPDESRYVDLDHARKAYSRFITDLHKTTTTRICTYATIHRPATELLMKMLDEAGFAAYVGKINMDRNSIAGLLETTDETIRETKLWLKNTKDLYSRVKPMLTPRYTPSCTDDCMTALGEMVKELKLPMQTHLSEGLDELEWVYEIMPDIEFYAQAYDRFGLFGTESTSVMAHCVFPTAAEMEMIACRDILVAHCPQSNLSGSGVPAPIMEYIEKGVKVGLGTDVAGSYTLNMNRIILDAIMASRNYWAFHEQKGNAKAEAHFLTLAHAFYLATKGGGTLWGKVGSFESGYELDAVVLDDTRVADFNPRSNYERVERLISLSDDRDIVAKYIAGHPTYSRDQVPAM